MLRAMDREAIESFHRMAKFPTVARHEVEDPDPYCFGDDPCVCLMLMAAREDERTRHTPPT